MPGLSIFWEKKTIIFCVVRLIFNQLSLTYSESTPSVILWVELQTQLVHLFLLDYVLSTYHTLDSALGAGKVRLGMIGEASVLMEMQISACICVFTCTHLCRDGQ